MTGALTVAPQLTQLAALAVVTCQSKRTREIYASALRQYLNSGRALTRDGVAGYISQLRDAGSKSSTLNQALSAIKKLADEARIQGVLAEVDANAIQFIHADRVKGQRSGHWLSLERLQVIYAMPDRTLITGKRDAALLGLLAGCGLRREEAATVQWDRYQDRDGRMCLIDFMGKGNRIRTVPVPQWARADIDAWLQVLIGFGAAQPNSTILRGRHVTEYDDVSKPISGWGVWHVVTKYAHRSGTQIAPHDFRRTLARLMRQMGVELEQIQHMLGHEDVSTTMKYVGAVQELRQGLAGVDRIQMTGEDRN